MIELILIIGMGLSILALFILPIGIIEILIYSFSKNKNKSTPKTIAHFCILIALAGVIASFLFLFSLGTGNVSGLMLPFLMIPSGILCVLYLVFMFKNIKVQKLNNV